MTAFPITVFHNPDCSKSRAALDLIRARGFEPEIVLYRDVGWQAARLTALLARMGAGPRDVLRGGEPEAQALADDATDAQVLAAMVAHPILVERPIVETPLGVVVARPVERVFEVLPPL